MKKFIKKFLCMVMAMVFVVSSTGAVVSAADTTTDPNGDVIMRFLLISDVHNQNETFANAIRATYNYAQTQAYTGFDAILVNGDLTNYGTTEEFTDFRTSLDAVMEELGITESCTFMANMGNHDYGNVTNTDEVNEEYRQNFENIIGVAPDATYEVNGVPFIMVSPINHAGNYTSKIDWVSSELERVGTADNVLPTFVAQHYPSRDKGAYGSVNGSAANIDSCFENYPNVVDIASHSHADIGNPKSVMQLTEGGYTCINTGSLYTVQSFVSYTYNGQLYGYDVSTRENNGLVLGEKNYRSYQFYIVEVHENGVSRYRHYDLGQGEFYSTDFYVGGDYNNTLDYRTANSDVPTFAEGDEVTIDAIGTEGITVSFPQAQDTEGVEAYRVILRDPDGNENVNYVTAFYWENPLRATLTYDLDDLSQGTEYTVEVTAVDFYGIESTTPLTNTFTTYSYQNDLDTLLSNEAITLYADDGSTLWTGDTDYINENGFSIPSSSPYYSIASTNSYNLGDRFEFSTEFYRSNINASAYDNHAVLQIGPLGLVINRQAGTTDTFYLTYGYQSESSDGPIGSDYVIASATAASQEKATYLISFNQGDIVVYRDGIVILHMTAEEFAAAVPSYDFSDSYIKYRLLEPWTETYINNYSLKAIISRDATYPVTSGFSTDEWTLSGKDGLIVDDTFCLETANSWYFPVMTRNELMDLGDAFDIRFNYIRNNYNTTTSKYGYFAFGEYGVAIQGIGETNTATVALVKGYTVNTTDRTYPTDYIVSSSTDLDSPFTQHAYRVSYRDGTITVYRDGISVASYTPETAPDFSATQLAFKLLTTYSHASGDVAFSNFSVEKPFTVDELMTNIDALLNDDGSLADGMTQEDILLCDTMYNSLSDYQKPLVTNYATLESALSYVDGYDEGKAAEVDAIINALPVGRDITEADRADIQYARYCYDSLTDAQKEFVTTLDVLIAAEKAYSALYTVRTVNMLLQSTTGPDGKYFAVDGTLFAGDTIKFNQGDIYITPPDSETSHRIRHGFVVNAETLTGTYTQPGYNKAIAISEAGDYFLVATETFVSSSYKAENYTETLANFTVYEVPNAYTLSDSIDAIDLTNVNAEQVAVYRAMYDALNEDAHDIIGAERLAKLELAEAGSTPVTGDAIPFTAIVENEAYGSVTATRNGSTIDLSTDDVYENDVITLTAEAADGYAFQYWVNQTGLMVSADATMEVTADYTHNYFVAVFEATTAVTVTVNIDDRIFTYIADADVLSVDIEAVYSGQIQSFIDSLDTFKFTKTWEVLDAGDNEGMAVGDWLEAGTAITGNITVKPLFQYVETYYQITVNGESVNPNGYRYDTKVTVTDDTATYWEDVTDTENPYVISYETEYSFFVWGDRDLVSHSDEVTATPIVHLTNKADTNTDIITYQSERTVPGNAQIIRAGIMVAIGGADADQLVIENIDNVTIKAGYAQSTEGNGQYVVKLKGTNGTKYSARAFIILADGSVVYSDVIDQTYTNLANPGGNIDQDYIEF